MYSYIKGNYSEIGGMYKPEIPQIEHFFVSPIKGLDKMTIPEQENEPNQDNYTIMPVSDEINKQKQKMNEFKSKNNKNLADVKKKIKEDIIKQELKEKNDQIARDKLIEETENMMKNRIEKAEIKVQEQKTLQEKNDNSLSATHRKNEVFGETIHKTLHDYEISLQRVQEMALKNREQLNK